MLARLAGAAALAILATPAQAEVIVSSETGFVIRQAADVTAGTDEVWAQIIKPGGWWNGSHTYSGDAANMTIDPRAGGCFCEVLPSASSPRAAPRGSVEHMRVLYVEGPRVLRLSGALGPLQSEALQGTLTIGLKALDGGGTRIVWEYVVGGYMRQKTGEMAPLVDAVLGEQVTRLAAKLGPKARPPAQPQEPPKDAPKNPPQDPGSGR